MTDLKDRHRRWFQLHLSTAIILMLLAGGFLYLNCRAQQTYWPLTINGQIREIPIPVFATEGSLSEFSYTRGFPFTFNWFNLATGSTQETHLLPLLCNTAIGTSALVIFSALFEAALRRFTKN
jgi:hypothetical protein